MKKTALLFILITLTFCAMSQEDDVKIPDGVVYKKADKEVVQKVKDILKKELSDPEYILFDKFVYCGPNYWEKNKHLPIKKGNIIFKVPQPDGSLEDMQGKLVQTKEDFTIIWDQIIEDFRDNEYTIRKIYEPELKFFWSIIFYDVEEPIFVIDNSTEKLILDFTSEGKLLFISLL